MKKYFVYVHFTEDDVFYVGIGNKLRPYDKISRNTKWLNFVSRLNRYFVAIVAEFKSLRKAFDYEKFLIKQWLPECNFSHKPLSIDKSLKFTANRAILESWSEQPTQVPTMVLRENSSKMPPKYKRLRCAKGFNPDLEKILLELEIHRSDLHETKRKHKRTSNSSK